MRTFLAALAFILAFTLPASAGDVRIALPTLSLDSLPVIVAQDRDFFGKHGVKAEVIAMHSGSDAMKALVSGDADITATGFPEVGLLKARGVDVQFLVEQATRVPFTLVARTDLHVKSIADLRGKNVAISGPGSLTDYAAEYIFMHQGWDPKKDVGLIAVGSGGEMLGALVAKKVDAAVIQEPFRSAGLIDGSITVVADLTKLDYLDAFPSGPLVAQRSFFEKSPADAKGVRDAIVEALQYIHNNKAGALAIARKTFPGIKPDVLAMAFERETGVFSRDGKFPPKTLARTQAICKQLGIIDTIYSYEDLVAPIAR